MKKIYVLQKLYEIKKFLISLQPNKEKRRKKRQQNTILWQNQTAAYLKEKYILPYLSGKLDNYDFIPLKNLDTDKIIWQYWGQGFDENLPDIVNTCLKSVEKYSDDYKIIRLTNENIKDYLILPDFVYEKLNNNKNFNYTFLSDLIRVSLLSIYGGIWIDATILLTGKISDNIISKKFFMFQRDLKPQNYKIWENYNRGYFCWDENFRVNVLNSFIISAKNNKIILALRDILLNYWKNENKFIYYYLFQVLFDELLKQKEFEDENCEIISDLIPHKMVLNINKDYNDNLWNQILLESNIHKLTYFKNIKQNSIASKILNLY